ncbi:sensor domain-containing diguanylate cyclase [Achromobacter sp. HNDS-1]|uniref:diguanylate cyclase n=1 Tax=Achromobacter sp. HNDS-1 TaxID=3151598 RepID=A0AAU7L7M9_9BURK|nr:sensor domain-containing diguanylate cyclase [Achromobacter ruhlandii]MCI1838128.1 sensor domain-containing diguanylate cyclase [Achromobacter ruhlandii]
MKSHGLLHRSLYALAGLIAIGICAAAVALLWMDRRITWNLAYVAASNLAEVLSADIGRTIRVYDLSLQGVIERLHEPDIESLPRATLQRFLFDRAASAEYLGTILILDRDGNIRYDSQSLLPSNVNFADRDFFQIHRDNADVGMYISRPYLSRLRGGDESIGISRRISNPDGSFAGVVSGSLRLAYFRERFASLSIGPRDAITIYRNDGVVIARTPYSSRDLGSDIGQALDFQQFVARREGVFVGVLAPDGVNRLYTFDSVPGAPLIIDVAMAVDEVLEPWVRRAMLIIPVTLALFASVMAQIVLYRRETRLRREVESQLEKEAQTDGLTGIANRRTFDEALAREWASAAREGQPLSLLFLDADRFKLYNDRYGHQEGDQLLKMLALTVRGKARRPRDLPARYGGEEFVALLPDTPKERALEVAERIREAVVGLRAQHEDNEGGIVTVSIGVATVIPGPDDDVATLVEAADAAVYRAKEMGRNRVVMADDPAAAG